MYERDLPSYVQELPEEFQTPRTRGGNHERTMELTEKKGITNQNHVFSLLTTGVMIRAMALIERRLTCDH